MFCVKCGAELREGASFCTKCGARVENPVHTTAEAGVVANPALSSVVSDSSMVSAETDQLNNPEDTSLTDTQRSNSPLPILVAVLLIILLAIFGMRYLRGNPVNKGSDTAEKSVDDTADSVIEGFDALIEWFDTRLPADIVFISSDVSDYPVIRLYFRVCNESGDQIILEDPIGGIREKVAGGAYIERTVRRLQKLEGNEGLSIDIVADKSGSMDADLPRMQQIMLDFVNSLDYQNGDRAELISFDSYVMYMCTHTQDTTLLANGISNMTAYGRTALYDALMEGVRNAAAQSGARCVIAFTDGQDNQSIYSAQEVIDYAVAMDVPIYIIGAGTVDTAILERITSQTGGFYGYISNLLDMNAILGTIYKEQKDMYCLEYMSDESIDAFATREVEWVFGDSTCGGSGSSTFTPQETREMMHHDTRYEVVKANVSWSEANAQAVAKGGHLITITSADEQKEAVALAKSVGLRFVWIGGYTSVRNGSVFGHWVTGESFDYSAWYKGEPSRNDKDGTPEMYLMLWNVREDEWPGTTNGMTPLAIRILVCLREKPAIS